MFYLQFYKMHVQHMLRKTGLSNQVNNVKIKNTCTKEQKVCSFLSHKLILSRRYAVQVCAYVIGKRHLVWLTTKQTHVKMQHSNVYRQ